MIRIVRDYLGAEEGRDKDVVVVKRLEWDNRQTGLDVLWSGVTNTYALTSDTAGVIDPSGQNNNSKITKVNS